MAELVVNIVLILAVLVLLTASLIGATRRRHQDRRQHAEERRLILQAFLGAAAPTEAAPQPPSEATRTVSATAPQHLDAASVATLLDLLEDRRPARRGLLTGLVNGPRGVWAAGARAGQHAGRRTMGQRAVGIEEAGPQLYRTAAREILDIHANDPRDAHLEYRRYADALGGPALAELYVRSAAHATYGEPDKVRLVERAEVLAAIARTGDGPVPDDKSGKPLRDTQHWPERGCIVGRNCGQVDLGFDQLVPAALPPSGAETPGQAS